MSDRSASRIAGPIGRGRTWRTAARAFLLVLGLLLVYAAGAAPHPDSGPAARITVVYNNVPQEAGLTTDWGFAAVVDSGDQRVLFDTGGDGRILLGNLARLGIPARSIDAVVLSHAHRDHTGGLDALLARHPDLTVYVLRSFGDAFRRRLERRGAAVETIDGSRRLQGELYTTGELGDAIREQALIIDTPAGLVILTGCAHPGIVAIAAAAQDQHGGRPIHLLLGGFHLRAHSAERIEAIVADLRGLGVQRVAPSHCTGRQATERFRERWGDAFIEGGCGAVIELR